MNTIRRLGTVNAAALGSFAILTVTSSAMGWAAECGAGTVYDPQRDACVLAPPAPPPLPPPPPPAPLGISICLPIPFVPICFPV